MFSQEARDAILAEERAELQQQQIDIDAMQSAAETSAVTEAMGPVGLPVQQKAGRRRSLVMRCVNGDDRVPLPRMVTHNLARERFR